MAPPQRAAASEQGGPPMSSTPWRTTSKESSRKFGEDGFEAMVHEVAGLERALGINDLRKFTRAT
jgi:hypothetical protein